MKKCVNQEKYNSDDFLCGKKTEKKEKNRDEKSVLGKLAHLYIHFYSRIIL